MPRSDEWFKKTWNTVIDPAYNPFIQIATAIEQLHEETEMPTYEDGYRKGVEDATEPIFATISDPAGAFSDGYNEQLFKRRKTLLTKKVTKYVIVLGESPVQETSIAQGRLWDSKPAAQHYLNLNYGISAIGVFPIEIEIPL